MPADVHLGSYRRAVDHLLEEGTPDAQPLSPVFIAEAYLRLLATIGGDAGCVVLLEDLHWADDETLAIVEYLADHASSTRVLAALTSRHDEPGAARPLSTPSVPAGRSARCGSPRSTGTRSAAWRPTCSASASHRPSPTSSTTARRASRCSSRSCSPR